MQQLHSDKDLLSMESALSVHYHVSIWTELSRLYKQVQRVNCTRFDTTAIYNLKKLQKVIFILYSICVIHHNSDTIFVTKNK